MIAAGMWLVSGCYYDVSQNLYPNADNGICDTTNVTYSKTINPIIIDRCNVCHSVNGSLGNIKTEGYSNLQTLALSGKLYGAVSHSPGFSAMPRDGSMLSKCQITYIRLWVAAGAKNN